MKALKIILTITAVISSTVCYSQNAELDQVIAQKIRSNALQAKALTESALQYESMIEQSEILEKMRNMYNKVSDGVKKFSPVKNSIYYMYKTIDLYKEIISDLRNLKDSRGNKMLSAEQIKTFDRYMLAVIADNAKNIKDLKGIIKDDNMKMNDGERMEIAKIIEERTARNYYKIRRLKSLFVY